MGSSPSSSSSSEIDNQLAITQDPKANPNNTNEQSAIAPIVGTTVTNVPVFVQNGTNLIPIADLNLGSNFNGGSSIAPITGGTYSPTGGIFNPTNKTPAYLRDAPPSGSRETILSTFQGTGDVAGAMEALADENALAYDQATPEDINRLAKEAFAVNPLGPSVDELKELMEARFAGSASDQELIHVTRANCYESVHLAAWFAGPGTGPMPQIRGGLAPLIDPQNMTEWEGGDIPRGQIIIGTTSETFGGQDQYGFYHVAVSLGNGLVANNRGSGIQIEKLEDVFGGIKNGLFYNEIYVGDYDGYKLPESGREFLLTERENNSDVIDAVASSDSDGLIAMFDPDPDDGHTPTPEQVQALADDAERESAGQIKIIDAVIGINPYPQSDELTDDMADYNRFVVQLMKGINGDKPFYHTDYRTWKAGEEKSQQPTPTPASAPTREPPSLNAGYENMSRFFVDAFGAAETAGLSTPSQQ